MPGLSERQIDAVLLDPPRTGAADAVRALATLRPPRVVYVSCDAPTLARDAKLLAQSGYRLARAVPLDLFPQTAHFEVVATFLR
jgi:23S rRNA (uracil1939-C5)-methyltransferase